MDIINHSDRNTERLILEGLEQRSTELAEEVRARMFMFEDVTQLEDRAVQILLRSVDNAGLWTAAQGGPPPAEWIAAARAGIRAGYGRGAPGDAVLRAFELVQAVHECLYAVAIAPFWADVARRALTTLLEEPCAS